MPSPKYTPSEALQKLRRYCSYQERCHQEVNQKLYEWGFRSNERGNLLTQMIEEGLLNEERFAKAIAGGKFRQKSWGRNKIAAMLKNKGVVSGLITTSMKEIDPAQYSARLEKLLLKKASVLKETNIFIKKQKLAKYAMGKGYESELVWSSIDSIFK